MKRNGKIGYFRLLEIEVILDNKEIIYKGAVEEAPEEIRNLEYVKSEMGSPLKLYVFS